MNIKQHIEAGHYPKDEKGRALVPTTDGRTYVVLCTDNPSDLPVVGYCTDSPDIISRQSGRDGNFLLPPPPRKVEVKRWVLLSSNDTFDQGFTNSAEQADEWRRTERCPVVELTGSYEEPWS